MKRTLALIVYGAATILGFIAAFYVNTWGEVFLCVNRAIHAESTIGMDRSEIWSWCRENHLNPFFFFR